MCYHTHNSLRPLSTSSFFTCDVIGQQDKVWWSTVGKVVNFHRKYGGFHFIGWLNIVIAKHKRCHKTSNSSYAVLSWWKQSYVAGLEAMPTVLPQTQLLPISPTNDIKKRWQPGWLHEATYTKPQGQSRSLSKAYKLKAVGVLIVWCLRQLHDRLEPKSSPIIFSRNSKSRAYETGQIA